MSVALIDFDFTATFSGLFSVSMYLCSSTFVAHRANGLPTSNYACHPGLGDFEVSFITPTCSRYAFRLFAIGGNDVYAHVSMTLYFRSQVYLNVTTSCSSYLGKSSWVLLCDCSIHIRTADLRSTRVPEDAVANILT